MFLYIYDCTIEFSLNVTSVLFKLDEISVLFLILDLKMYLNYLQRTIRGMLCDVFETRRNDFKFGDNPLGQSIFQFYFLSVS